MARRKGLRRLEFFLQTVSKALQLFIGTSCGSLQPGKQILAFVLTNQAHKILTECGEPRGREVIHVSRGKTLKNRQPFGYITR